MKNIEPNYKGQKWSGYLAGASRNGEHIFYQFFAGGVEKDSNNYNDMLAACYDALDDCDTATKKLRDILNTYKSSKNK